MNILVHIIRFFAKHYTCNCVCFWFDQPSLKIPWVLCKTYLMFEILREWIANLNFGKTGFKTCVFEKHFISYSCMWFIKFNALRSFYIILLCFSKNWFFQNFDQSKLRLKMFVSLCLFQSVLDWCWINQSIFDWSNLFFNRSKIV